MTKRRCRDCTALIDTGAYKGRCTKCARKADQARGSRTDRGYGSAHQEMSRITKQQVANGEPVICWRCGLPITDPDDVHIGHDDNDRTIVRGAEHGRGCNLRAAGLASHGKSAD